MAESSPRISKRPDSNPTIRRLDLGVVSTEYVRIVAILVDCGRRGIDLLGPAIRPCFRSSPPSLACIASDRLPELELYVGTADEASRDRSSGRMRLFRFTKARIAFLHDVFMAAISFPLALYIRVGDSFFWYADRVLLVGTVVFTAVAALCFWSMRLYRGVWHYASLNDVMQIAKAATVAILIFMSLMFVITRLDDIPRSMLVIEWLLLISLVGGSRIAYRIAKDKRFDTMLRKENYRRIPVLLFGAGDMAEQFIRATTLPENATHQVVGLIDDHGTRIGRKIHGVDVLGGLTDFEDIVRALQTRGNAPQRVIVATADIDGKQMRELLNRAQAMGLPLSRIPRMTDLQSGDEDGIPTRPIAVEDLLGRPQKVLDRDAMRTLVEGRRVLITGAGGTIGSELARQIAGLAPRQISLLDSSEFALYEIDLEIGIALPDLPRSIALADVRDRARVQRVFETEAPEIVFHAAALKHVPMVENNPLEGVLTNVVGTRNVADAARQRKIATVVLISTDKAVNPTNVMGATKRLAETYCQALDILGGRTGCDTLRHRPFRQCAGIDRLGRAPLPAADRRGRPGHRDPSRSHPVLHDHSRGGRTGDRGFRPGQPARETGRQDIRSRYGRAGADTGLGPPDDPPRRTPTG